MSWNGNPNNPHESGWHFVKYIDDFYAYPHGDTTSEAAQYSAEFWDSELQTWTIYGFEPDGIIPSIMKTLTSYHGPIFPSYSLEIWNDNHN